MKKHELIMINGGFIGNAAPQKPKQELLLPAGVTLDNPKSNPYFSRKVDEALYPIEMEIQQSISARKVDKVHDQELLLPVWFDKECGNC